jgi:VCBS repeat-containing protein
MLILLMSISFIVGGIVSFNDLQINTYNSLDQKDVAVTKFHNERCLAVWNSYDQDGDSGGIFGQQLDNQGQLLGTELQINHTTKNNQAEPSVAVNGNGFYLVAWRGPGSDSDQEDIFTRCLDPNRTAVTEDIQINVNTAGSQVLPRVAGSKNGNFMVVWENEDHPNATKSVICGRLIGPDGQPLTDELLLSDRSYNCRYGNVDMRDNGDFVVVWLEDRTVDYIRTRHFDATGTAQGDSLQANTERFKSLTWPSIAINHKGTFAVAWDGDPNYASDDDIHARLFQHDGSALTDEFIVNTTRDGTQRNPYVALNNNGRWVVVWDHDTGMEGHGRDVYGQCLDNNGQSIGPEFQVNHWTAGDQQEPVVTLSDQNTFVALWESDDQDGSGTGIFAFNGPQAQSADLNTDGQVDFYDFQLFAHAWDSASLSLADLIQDDYVNYVDLKAFCAQWLTLYSNDMTP